MAWEYAARGGEEVIHPWGNAPVTGTRANFCDVNCSRALADPSRLGRRADPTPARSGAVRRSQRQNCAASFQLTQLIG